MLYFFLIIIQVCIESLPLSSSGHQVLVERLCTISLSRSLGRFTHACAWDPALLKQFNHFLHVFELCILGYFFRNRLKIMLLHPIRTRRIIMRSLMHNSLSAVITALLYFSFFARYDFSNLLLYGFIITALILFSVDYIPAGNKQSVPWHSFAFLGIVQAVALIPGISRFAITYTASRLLGLTHRASFETCFSIQIPLVIGSLLQMAYKGNLVSILQFIWDPVFAGVCLLATLISYQLFCLSERLAFKKQWKLFAFYMIIPILLSFMLLLQ